MSSSSSDSGEEEENPLLPPPPPKTQALRRAMAGRPKEPVPAIPTPGLTMDSFWICKCSENRDICRRHNHWASMAKKQDHFSQWLASKHLVEIKEEDYFPIYMLLKLRYTESRATLRDMFYDCQSPAKWMINPQEVLQLFADHERPPIPWQKPARIDWESDEAYQKRVIHHLRDVVNVLLQHYFYWFDFEPTHYNKLVHLVGDIYRDLLKLNQLDFRSYPCYFHLSWLNDFLERNHVYERLIHMPYEFASDNCATEISCTVVMHAKKAPLIKWRDIELKVPEVESAGGNSSADSTISASDSERVAEMTSGNGKKKKEGAPSTEEDGANPKLKKEQERKLLLERLLDCWEDSYANEMFYDPFEDDMDICDCTNKQCPGCFDICLNCNSRKCSDICRQTTAFYYGDLVANHVPEQFFWRKAYREELARKAEEKARAEGEPGPSGRVGGGAQQRQGRNPSSFNKQPMPRHKLEKLRRNKAQQAQQAMEVDD